MVFASNLPADLHGRSFVGGKAVADTGKTFQKASPVDGAVLGDITLASPGQVEAALEQAHQAYMQDTLIEPSSRHRRAAMLEAVAKKLEQRKEDLRLVYGLESGLPTAAGTRFDNEFGRTVNQLRHHAKRLTEHTHFIPVIDSATPFGWIGKTMRGIGPVLVLGAINFPLAFSTAGGDFADAWASGCPVVMKAHAQHPLTSEIVASCIIAALQELGAHQGWFSLIHCDRELTQKMMGDERIKAGALTGSLNAARELKKIADGRNVPFYAECGSVNPVFLLPEKLAADPVKLADDYVASVTMGAGQFCTCPGLMIAIEGPGFDQFAARVVELINAKTAATMLSTRTKRDYLASVKYLSSLSGMSVMAGGGDVDHITQTKPTILTISGADFLSDAVECQTEAFGHCSVVIKATSMGQVLAIANALVGNLTATRYGTAADLSSADGMKLRRTLETKAGRNIANAMPTGVAVCNAMTHGGPDPACTINSSSVGGSLRFMVEVCYQGEPDENLPAELKRGNPDRIMRLQNGQFTSSMLPS